MEKLFFFCVFFLGYLTAIYATSSFNTSCLEHEKTLATLEIAEILLTKAGASFPICKEYVNSTDESECGRKKPLAYIEISKKLISDLRKNFPTCAKPIEKDDKTVKDEKPRDCSEVLVNGNNESGIYTIWTDESFTTGKALQVFCDMDTDKGGWTVIQRRGKYPVQQDFYLGWESYKNGFGNLTEEFWLGNENIRVLCQKECEIRFDLQDEDGEKGFAHYETFMLDKGDYTLHIGGYTGNVGDDLGHKNNRIFTTKDNQTRIWGGWWHGSGGIYSSNINGIYKPGEKDGYSVIWYSWRGLNNLASAEMKIRPKVKLSSKYAL